jgi:hypothetical protein
VVTKNVGYQTIKQHLQNQQLQPKFRVNKWANTDLQAVSEILHGALSIVMQIPICTARE